jgi:predicted nucleic acid-binding Zn ribbon protein
MEKACSLCDRPEYARGLCSRHYQHARRHGELPHQPVRTCAECSEPMHGKTARARYCSQQCKEKARQRDRRAAALAEAGERRCLNCQIVIPEHVTLKAKCCSRECGIAWENTKRADEKRTQLLAMRGPCPGCGGPIPEENSGRWKYCSTACKRRAHSARWRIRSPHYMRQYLYGLSQERYEAMMAEQDSRCAICGSPDWPAAKDQGRPRVDHDHATRKVRGLLCDFCNRGLGMFDEDPARLRAAAEYLEKNG